MWRFPAPGPERAVSQLLGNSGGVFLNRGISPGALGLGHTGLRMAAMLQRVEKLCWRMWESPQPHELRSRWARLQTAASADDPGTPKERPGGAGRREQTPYFLPVQ